MTRTLDQQIKQRTFIAASPEKVYATITSAREWDSFFTTGMRLDPRPGGQCVFAWKNWGPDSYTLEAPGEVLKAEPPRIFTFKWGTADRATKVNFELTEKDNGTVVTLTEDGYRDDPDGRAMIMECASGWGEALTLLKFYIEHGITYTTPAAVTRSEVKEK
jgi:uncharacterized protein YndB with AHSA1/START domain